MSVQIKPQLKLNTIFYFGGYNMPNSLCSQFSLLQLFRENSSEGSLHILKRVCLNFFVYYVECTDI